MMRVRIDWASGLAALMGAVLGLALPAARAAAPPVQWRQLPPIAPYVAALPRLTLPTGKAANRINTILQQADERVAQEVKDCEAEPPAPARPPVLWRRDVAVTMSGPGYLGLVATETTNCQSDQTTTSLVPQVFDLTTGALVNWRQLMPRKLARNAHDEDDGTIISAPLQALFLKGYATTAHPGLDDSAWGACQAVLRGTGQSFTLWPDAQARAIAMLPAGLVPSRQACAIPVLIGLGDLRSLGVAAKFRRDVATAHGG